MNRTLLLVAALTLSSPSSFGRSQDVEPVKAAQYLGAQGELAGLLEAEDGFGKRIAALGDVDGDGVVDLAVSARHDDDGGYDRGAVWIVFLNEDGTLKGKQKISALEGGFTGALDDIDYFGDDPAGLGDLDGDGVVDVAVSAVFDDDGGTDRGAVWILFLNRDGSVKGHRKISSLTPSLAGSIADGDWFGGGLCCLGDLQGDGIIELAVGASRADGGGAVWLLSITPSGTVVSSTKISQGTGGFDGALEPDDRFGISIAGLGDLNDDGLRDIAVGAFRDDDGGSEAGALWVLFLDASGQVLEEQCVSASSPALAGLLEAHDHFGISLAFLGDPNGDGLANLAVGARGDDDGGVNRGALWLISLAADGTVASAMKVSDTEGGFSGGLQDGDRFGHGVAMLGDLDGDVGIELAVGADMDDDLALEAGAVWILFLAGPPIAVTHIESALAQAPGEIKIGGVGFDSAVSVLVNELPVPIVSIEPQEIVIQPGPGTPGFQDVKVVGDAGSVVIPKGLHLLPTAAATASGIGGQLQVTLDNGTTGIYALALATGSLPAPIPIASPPTWHGVLLDPSGPLFTIDTGSFPTSDPLDLAFPIPSNPALSGLAVHLQAWCQQGFFGPSVTYSFTNLATASI